MKRIYYLIQILINRILSFSQEQFYLGFQIKGKNPLFTFRIHGLQNSFIFYSMNQKQLLPKITIISKLSSKIRLIWAQYGFSKQELDSKMIRLVLSFLPNHQTVNLKNLRLQQVIYKIFTQDKNNISQNLTKIVAVLDGQIGQLKLDQEEQYIREEKQQISSIRQQSLSKKKWQYLPKQLMKSMKKQFQVKLQKKQRDEDYLPIDLSDNSDSQIEYENKTNNFQKSLKDTLARTKMLRAYLQYQLKDQTIKSRTSPFSRLREDFLSSC